MLGVAVFALGGCATPSDGAADLDPETEEITPSRRPTLKLKNHYQIGNDVADALELDASEVCLELGRYSCTDEVHRLALGGTSPYDEGRYVPLARTPITGPIAVERIALSACIERVDRDLTDPSRAVVFRDLPVRDGSLTTTDSAQARDSLTRLIERVLRRPARGWELSALLALYDVAAEHSERPARDWAVAACSSVVSSVETLLY